MYTLEDILLTPDSTLRRYVTNNSVPDFTPHDERGPYTTDFMEPMLFLLEPENKDHIRRGLWQLTRYLYLGRDENGHELNDSRSDLDEWVFQDLPYLVEGIDKRLLVEQMKDEFANPIRVPERGFPVGFVML